MLELVDTFWSSQILETMNAEVAQRHLVRQPVQYQVVRRLRQDHLTAMGEIAQTSCPGDREADVVGVTASLDLAGVHAKTDGDRPPQQRTLNLGPAGDRIRRA